MRIRDSTMAARAGLCSLLALAVLAGLGAATKVSPLARHRRAEQPLERAGCACVESPLPPPRLCACGTRREGLSLTVGEGSRALGAGRGGVTWEGRGGCRASAASV